MHKHTNKNAPFPAQLYRVERRGEDGQGDNQIAAVVQHRTRAERDAPLLCIAALSHYLTHGCGIVFIVEREIGNPQVRKDF